MEQQEKKLKFTKLNELEWDEWAQDASNYLMNEKLSKILVFPNFDENYKSIEKTTNQSDYWEMRELIENDKKLTTREKKEEISYLHKEPHISPYYDSWEQARLIKKERWESDDERVRGILNQHVEAPFRMKLLNCKSAYEMWRKIRELCDSNDKLGKKLLLITKLEIHNYTPDTMTLSEYIKVHEVLFNKVVKADMKLDEEVSCLQMLVKLPKEFSHLITTTIHNESLTFTKLINKFSLEDAKDTAQYLIDKNKPNEERANQMRTKVEGDKKERKTRTCAKCPKSLPHFFRRDQTLCHSCFIESKKGGKKEEANETREKEKNEESHRAFMFNTTTKDK
ncbi:MAG TPA: hypothetical protein VER35_01640, partial [Candidatus Limnocylindrales bacterium]|nr:hypothetical protein [Candidatus Limnocylindrales bacterium]